MSDSIKLMYDETNPDSIEAYAKELIGMNFRQVEEESPYIELIKEKSNYANRKRKGGLGNLLEEAYFGYKANSESEADFSKAGVELKVTPYEVRKGGKLSAGERLVLSMISYTKPIEDDLYSSHMWNKCKLMLLIYYLRDKTLKSNMEYPIRYVSLFTPSKEDLLIIEQDYKIISDKIRNGKAHELSEGDTMYLGACTKGATAEKSTVFQSFYAPDVKARKRAFCFKTSYMTYILNNYIVAKDNREERIIKDKEQLLANSFEDVVINRINSYKGKTDKELCELFNREYNNNKAQWIDLAYRMLGIKSNAAEEFKKANVVVKAIRMEEDNKIQENMSFPAFKFMDIVTQDWEDSQLCEYFSVTKFLFVVFKKNERGTYELRGAQFWNMSVAEIEGDLKDVWIQLRNILLEGVKLIPKKTKSGYIVNNNLPKTVDNPIVHIRPHSQKGFYIIDGIEYGNGTIKDANLLPDGNYMTTQSFWVHREYIVSKIDNNLKK